MLNYIKNIGIERGDSVETRLQKFTILIISLSCCTAAPIWSTIYFLMGMHIAAIGPLLYFVLVMPSIMHFVLTKKEKLLVNVQLFSIFLCPTFMQCASGGFISGGVVILWSFLAPLSALLFHDVKKARNWMFVTICCIVLTAACNGLLEQFGTPIPQSYRILLIAMNLGGPSLAIYFAMQYFVNNLIKNSQLLQNEKHKSDMLLLNILPAKVAEELKKTGSASPTKFIGSTVIFTDFKDFTKIAEQLSPEELIQELDHCFKAFDEITSSFGLEKIKTIGDSYMCVSGIPVKTGESTMNAIRAALKMSEYIQMVRAIRKIEGRPYWDIRIGIHTGDVVAGIVGKHKFAYDIWGDAVNTASRMESSGEAGRVNISGSTYELIKNQFNCTYRGKIPAKNKGVIDMYFVDSAA